MMNDDSGDDEDDEVMAVHLVVRICGEVQSSVATTERVIRWKS